MDVVLLLIMAAAGLSAVPSHAVRQYHFVSEAKNMSEAQRYCREKHTDLVTVDSMEVVKLLNDMAGQYQSAWIGLHDDRDTWKWSMSDPSFYGPGEKEFRQWGSDQPVNLPLAQCSYFNDGGTWYDLDCNRPLRVICFDVTGQSATFVRTDSNMTWTEAQSYCREHHTDLASVRNQAENQQIDELIAGGRYWIGLYRDSWKWSDGSNSSFNYWAYYEPNHKDLQVCAIAAFVYSGKWMDLECWKEKPFICYGDVVPVSMQVIKVRVENPNGVNLNDQAFLDAMLVEAKNNLRAQGLDDNVQLAWRKQPDGQVFYEDEEDKKKKRDEL